MMKVLRRQGKGHLFWHYMLQYLLLILLILAAMLPIYHTSLNIIQRDLQEKTESSLKQGIRTFDNELRNLYNVAQLLRKDISFLNCAAFGNDLAPADYLELQTASCNFQQYAVPLTLCENITVLFEGNSHVLEPNRVYPMASSGKYPYEEMLPADYQALYDSLFAPMARDSLSGLITVDSARESVVFILYLNDIRSVLRAVIPLSGIVETLSLGDLEGMVKVEVEDPAGEILRMAGTGSGSTCGFTLKSDYSNLRITVSVPQSWYAKQVLPIQNMIFFYISATFVLAVAAAFFFSRQNCRPLLKILQSLARSSLHSGMRYDYQNDLQYIESAIRHIADESTAIRKQNESLEQVVQSKIIEALLNHSNEESIQLFYQHFPYFPSFFRMVLLSGRVSERWEVQRYLEQRFSFAFCVPTEENQLACLIAEKELSSLREALLPLSQSSELRISVSLAFTSPQSICYAYRQVRYIVRFLDAPGLIVTDDVQYRQFAIDEADSRRILEQLLAGNAAEAKQLLLTEWYDLSLLPFPDDRIERLFYQQSSVMRQAARLLDAGEELCLPPFDSRLSISELALQICEAAEVLCAESLLQKNIKTDHKAEELVAFIDQQCLNPDFSPPGLSEHFGLSLKTIGKLFRQQTGENISDYVLRRRLGHAQELLLEGVRNINEITEACGFSSQNTFYKAFRREFGVSPTAWRESHRS